MLENWARAAGFAAILIVALSGSLFWEFRDYVLFPIECHTGSDNYYECLLDEYTRQVALFTAVLASATIILAIVTFVFAGFQFRDTRILQRAYLSVAPRGIHKMTDGTYIAYIAFQNGGNLPAKNVRNQVNVKWFNNGDKSDFDPVMITEPGAIMLSPKIKVERGTGPMSAEDAARYEAKKGFIFVWGRLEYEDGFRHPRWLTFCHRYNCAKPQVFRHHHHHNDGD